MKRRSAQPAKRRDRRSGQSPYRRYDKRPYSYPWSTKNQGHNENWRPVRSKHYSEALWYDPAEWGA